MYFKDDLKFTIGHLLRYRLSINLISLNVGSDFAFLQNC